MRMRRKWKHLLSLQAAAHLRFIPRIVWLIRNWQDFLITYIGLGSDKGKYVFRNGLIVNTDNPDDVATLVVVFFKKEYGRIPEDAVIVDIGANIGTFSLYAATAAKNTKVFAYEPMPTTYSLLSKNVADNHLQKRILIRNVGIWKKKDRLKLFLSNTSPFHSVYEGSRKGSYLQIDVIALDAAFKKDKITCCDLMKIDCEGAEYEILYNASANTLSRIKEIRMEYHEHEDADEEHTFEALRSFLEKNRFKLTYWDAERDATGIAWFKRTDA